MSTTTTETLEVTVERGPKGGFGIAIVPGSNGDAYVDYVQDKAKESGLIQAGDHITHVGGDGPLQCRAACAKLREATKEVKVRVIRGEPKQEARRRSGSWVLPLSITILAAATIWPLVSTEEFGQVLQAMQQPPAADGAAADGGEGGGKRTSGPAMQIGGKKFILEDDGSAPDPDALRAAMRGDKEMMASLRQNEPDWATVIAGKPDGSYDVAAFQKVLRKNFHAHASAQATKLNEDGTAVDPEAYLKVSLKDKKWVASVKKMPDEQLKEGILRGEPEALQQLLRQSKASASGEKQAAEQAMPPNPPTPYDDVGQVEMSFRILTDEGEEKDLYSLRAKQTDEEKYELPRHMQCAACEASAYQGALAVSKALKSMYTGDLVGVTTLEAMQETCADVGLFTQAYGVVPTKTGINAYTGPGITERKAGFTGDEAVMLQTQHSNEWGKKLSVACQGYLEGAEADEDELAAVILEADKKGVDDAGPTAFKELLCQKACAPDE